MRITIDIEEDEITIFEWDESGFEVSRAEGQVTKPVRDAIDIIYACLQAQLNAQKN